MQNATLFYSIMYFYFLHYCFLICEYLFDYRLVKLIFSFLSFIIIYAFRKISYLYRNQKNNHFKTTKQILSSNYLCFNTCFTC